MVPRENKTRAYAKFGGTNKEYYGIFESGLFETRKTQHQDWLRKRNSVRSMWGRRIDLQAKYIKSNLY